MLTSSLASAICRKMKLKRCRLEDIFSFCSPTLDLISRYPKRSAA